jgi:hypothetical protein
LSTPIDPQPLASSLSARQSVSASWSLRSHADVYRHNAWLNFYILVFFFRYGKFILLAACRPIFLVSERLPARLYSAEQLINSVKPGAQLIAGNCPRLLFVGSRPRQVAADLRRQSAEIGYSGGLDGQ